MQPKFIYSLAAFYGLSAVVVGALNAHYFKRFLSPEAIEGINTAVKYQFIHTIMIFVAPLFLAFINAGKSDLTICFFAVGIALFSGSIYGLNALKYHQIAFPKIIGLITPIGGLSLILGWASFFYSLITSPNTHS